MNRYFDLMQQRKICFVLILALTGVLTSCSREDNNADEDESIMLSSYYVEVPATGGTIDIEVLANCDYEVIIDNSDSQWIHQQQSRGRSSVRSFSIDKNERYEKRRGLIIFRGKSVEEIVSVCQEGSDINSIVLSGYWQGYMGDTYYDYWGYENYKKYKTIMNFSRNGYSTYSKGVTTGQGEQIDYLDNTSRAYRRYFYWEVDWDTIYIKYENGEQVRISSFNINDRYLNGTMRFFDRYGSQICETSFDFTRTDGSSWNHYYDW